MYKCASLNNWQNLSLLTLEVISVFRNNNCRLFIVSQMIRGLDLGGENVVQNGCHPHLVVAPLRLYASSNQCCQRKFIEIPRLRTEINQDATKKTNNQRRSNLIHITVHTVYSYLEFLRIESNVT